MQQEQKTQARHTCTKSLIETHTDTNTDRHTHSHIQIQKKYKSKKKNNQIYITQTHYKTDLTAYLTAMNCVIEFIKLIQT